MDSRAIWGRRWGYHFWPRLPPRKPVVRTFVRTGEVFDRPDPGTFQSTRWLGDTGQCGASRWSISETMAALILRLAKPYVGRSELEIGTSRGRLTALLAEAGLRMTTLDREDRGAAANLEGLPVTVLREDLVRYLSPRDKTFDLVVIDLHGNTAADWNRYHDA